MLHTIFKPLNVICLFTLASVVWAFGLREFVLIIKLFLNIWSSAVCVMEQVKYSADPGFVESAFLAVE